MNADFEMYSWSKNHHRVSWPDGVEVEVHASNAVAMQIGQGRALLRELASTAGALSTASRRMSELAEHVQGEVDTVLAYVDSLKPSQPSSTGEEKRR
jgi:hypothetical protein